MSFNRLTYDTGSYRKEINQSVGPGNYYLSQPSVGCKPCIPAKAGVHLQKSGASIRKDVNMVDLDSELLGLFRKNSRNPDRKYKPQCEGYENNNGEPCGGGVSSNCSYDTKLKHGERPGDENLVHWADCFQPPEDTRLSNPPCTLKEVGINRFEWLCNNPQRYVERPFEHSVSNRLLVKDNHKPIIPKPIDDTACLPESTPLQTEYGIKVPMNNTSPQSTCWRNCNYLKTC